MLHNKKKETQEFHAIFLHKLFHPMKWLISPGIIFFRVFQYSLMMFLLNPFHYCLMKENNPRQNYIHYSICTHFATKIILGEEREFESFYIFRF